MDFGRWVVSLVVGVAAIVREDQGEWFHIDAGRGNHVGMR